MDVDQDVSLSDVSDSVLLDEVEPYKWEEWQKDVMTEHRKYYLDMITHAQQAIELITLVYQDGPVDAESDIFNENKPVLPISNLGAVVYENGSAAYQAVARKNSKKVAKSKRSAEELNKYLKSQLVGTDEVQIDDGEFYTSVDNMEKGLKERYKKLCKKNNDILREHIIFGKQLKMARVTFKKKKQEWSITERWQKWIANKVGICNSSVRRYIQMYEFVSVYPRLLNLCMTYTSLFKMKREIEDAFTLCDAIASEWKQ